MVNSDSAISPVSAKEKRAKERKTLRSIRKAWVSSFSRNFPAGPRIQYSVAMRPGSSSLNPYAAAYIPLSKRVTSGNNEVLNANMKDSESGNEIMQNKQTDEVFRESDVHGTEKLSVPVAFLSRNRSVYGSYSSSVKHLVAMEDNQMMDEGSEMDLENLRIMFPGISVESITCIYLAYNRDVGATIDMLRRFESSSVEPSENPEPFDNLPDTLDIGDVPESGPPAEQTSWKLKNVANGNMVYSSGPSGSAGVF